MKDELLKWIEELMAETHSMTKHHIGMHHALNLVKTKLLSLSAETKEGETMKCKHDNFFRIDGTAIQCEDCNAISYHRDYGMIGQPNERVWLGGKPSTEPAKPLKSVEEIKDEVARDYGHKDWKDVALRMPHDTYDTFISLENEVIKRLLYAEQFKNNK